jgi:hypothetical protein
MLRPTASITLAALLLFAPGGRAPAQQPSTNKQGLPPASSDLLRRGAGDEDDNQSSRTEEMVKSAEIRRDEAAYKETLERAREAAQLGSDVREAYRRQSSLAAAEIKKLARIEKLARSIRNDAGGGDGGDAKLDDPPPTLAAALERLADLCEDFRKKVEKTPRHVVSAAVITSANQLIELTRLIKTLGG